MKEFVEDSRLYGRIKDIIVRVQNKTITTVKNAQMISNWEIGREIIETEQKGGERAGYGKQLLKQISERLTAEFGYGYDESNLRYMRLFYRAFPNCDALRHELSWTHYRIILRVENEKAREYYLKEAAEQGWSTRALERQVNSLYYERLLSSGRNKAPVEREAEEKIKEAAADPKEFIRDPVILEFLGLPGNAGCREKDLEQALISHIQQFLLELGKGFAFVARQQHIKTETSNFFIDLVFYNYELKCFVLVDLKTGKLTHQDAGQMDMYVRMYDDLKKGESDNPTIGIILCTDKDETVVKYSVLNDKNNMFAARYRLYLPSEEELKKLIENDRFIIEEESAKYGVKI